MVKEEIDEEITLLNTKEAINAEQLKLRVKLDGIMLKLLTNLNGYESGYYLVELQRMLLQLSDGNIDMRKVLLGKNVEIQALTKDLQLQKDKFTKLSADLDEIENRCLDSQRVINDNSVIYSRKEREVKKERKRTQLLFSDLAMTLLVISMAIIVVAVIPMFYCKHW